MTIRTIEVLNATNEQPLDDVASVTRADVHKDEIRLFAGRKVQQRLPLPEGAKPEVVEGILAGLAYPISEAALRTSLEDALLEADRRSGSVIPDGYRHTYGVDQNCGDQVAVALKDYCGGGLKDKLDLSKLEEVVDQNGIRERFDVWMERGLNPGMLRMNTGNVLRGMARNEKRIQIGEQVWNAEPASAEA